MGESKDSALHRALNRYLDVAYRKGSPGYNEAEHAAAARDLDALIESTERAAQRWQRGSKIARLDENGDGTVTFVLGSSKNVEQHCGPWPDSVRDRLLRGEELCDSADVDAIYDHAHRITMPDARTPPDVAVLAREALEIIDPRSRDPVWLLIRAPHLLRALARAVLDREGEGATWFERHKHGAAVARWEYVAEGVRCLHCGALEPLSAPLSSPSPVVVAEAWEEYDARVVETERMESASVTPGDAREVYARRDAARARLTSLLSGARALTAPNDAAEEHTNG